MRTITWTRTWTTAAWTTVAWTTVALAATLALPARARAQSNLSDPCREGLSKLAADLDDIEKEARGFPDAPAAMRMQKLIERMKANLGKAGGGTARTPLAAPGSAARAGVPTGGLADAPAAGAGKPAGAGGSLTADEFKDLVKAVKNQSMDSSRLGLIRGTLESGNKRLLAAQIGQLVHWFGSSDMRVETAAVLYPLCSDPGGYAVVYSKLDSEEAKANLKARIEGSVQEAPAVRTAPKGKK